MLTNEWVLSFLAPAPRSGKPSGFGSSSLFVVRRNSWRAVSLRGQRALAYTDGMRITSRCCVACLVVRDGRVLLVRHARGSEPGGWSPPGGHLDFGETPEAYAARETLEETGVRVEGVTSPPRHTSTKRLTVT